MQNLYIVVLLAAAVVAVSWLKPSLLPRHLHAALSRAIHVSPSPQNKSARREASNTNRNQKIYLCWRYPIKDQAGAHSLPTCPYSWPNGQGDVGKFLEGIENSEVWGKKYGKVYRIWSGMKSEV